MPVTEREIEQEMDKILANATGEIDPVVVRLSNQVQYGWELVEGRKRLEAYRRLGYTPGAGAGPGRHGSRCGDLESGAGPAGSGAPDDAAAVLVGDAAAQAGRLTQREQARHVAVKESTMSGYIKVARALPEVWARGVAAQTDVPMAELEALPRKTRLSGTGS